MKNLRKILQKATLVGSLFLSGSFYGCYFHDSITGKSFDFPGDVVGLVKKTVSGSSDSEEDYSNRLTDEEVTELVGNLLYHDRRLAELQEEGWEKKNELRNYTGKKRSLAELERDLNSLRGDVIVPLAEIKEEYLKIEAEKRAAAEKNRIRLKIKK